MELSDTEKKMVARLRRKQETILRWRWFMLLFGIGFTGASFYLLSMLTRFAREPDLAAVLMISCFLPPIYLFLVFGAGTIGYTWANWHGNPQDKLLLRLIDERCAT